MCYLRPEDRTRPQRRLWYPGLAVTQEVLSTVRFLKFILVLPLMVFSVTLRVIRVQRLLTICQQLLLKQQQKQDQLKPTILYPYFELDQWYLTQKAYWHRLNHCRQQIVNTHSSRLFQQQQLRDRRFWCLLCYPMQPLRQVSSNASASLLQTSLNCLRAWIWMKSPLYGAHAQRVTPLMIILRAWDGSSSLSKHLQTVSSRVWRFRSNFSSCAQFATLF